jgi:peptidoglycan hydrolase-like protein with peptidoglycan-binding domain
MADLSTGAMGSDVSRNQAALNQAGKSRLPSLQVDGLFGPKTKARVMEFQRDHGLAADGIIGHLTRAKLGTTAPEAGAHAGPADGAGQSDDELARTIGQAAKAAIGHWQANAKFNGVMIHGAVATGRPGCLSGPALHDAMGPWLAKLQGEDRTIAQAAGKGLGNAFERWQTSVAIPGLPWYPAFASFPGPAAPPTANIPCPLVALTSTTAEMMSANALAQAMQHAAAGGASTRSSQVFAKVAEGMSTAFAIYLSNTMVTNVIGRGPVPGFAPPAVTSGPVVGGSVTSAPGVLSGPGLLTF